MFFLTHTALYNKMARFTIRRLLLSASLPCACLDAHVHGVSRNGADFVYTPIYLFVYTPTMEKGYTWESFREKGPSAYY